MKLVVLTSRRFGIASSCILALAESRECTVTGVIVSRGRAANRVRRFRQKAKKTMRIGLLGALNGLRMRSWYEDTPATDVVELCGRLGIPVFQTDRTNSDETVRLMRESEAELGLSLGNSYIAERVYAIPKFGMINVHGERLPEYRNAQSVIWEIYNLEIDNGVDDSSDRPVDRHGKDPLSGGIPDRLSSLPKRYRAYDGGIHAETDAARRSLCLRELCPPRRRCNAPTRWQ